MNVKRAAISVFIITSLWVMVSTNLSLPSPLILPRRFPPDEPGNSIGRVNWGIRFADWGAQRAGWAAGLKNYWRMFSPVDRFNWEMQFTGVDKNGNEVFLPLPHQLQRSFFERNFTDFREGKFHVNIYGNPQAQRMYADHLCKIFSAPERPLASVDIGLSWQTILPPEQAKTQGRLLDGSYARPWGTFPCPPDVP